MWCHHSEKDQTKEVGAWRNNLLKTPEESPKIFLELKYPNKQDFQTNKQ